MRIFLAAATLTLAFVTFEYGVYVGGKDTEIARQTVRYMDAERIARMGKTDKEWYAIHPEAKGD